MAYVGNTPADKTLKLEKQQFTTSATTTYTLSHSVSDPQDIALFINNVRQNPNSSYTVSGTTLTLSAATASTDTMYCVFLGRAIGTVGIAAGSVTKDKVDFISDSSGSGVISKGDGSSIDGSIQLNCHVNSHGIKLKSPPHSAGQSYTLTFPSTAPSAGKVLQTDGSGNLSFASVGSLIHLNTVTISSAVSSINFNSTYINSTYDVYKLFFKNVKGANDNDYMSMRFSFDNGSNIISGSSYGQATLGGHTGTASDVVNSRYYSSGSAISLIGQGSYAGNDTGEDAVGEITIFNSNIAYKKVQGHTTYYHTGGGMFTNQYSAELKSNRTDRLNYIQIFFGNGNISQGSFHLFGVQDA
tara:strand:+ start:310 stop:1377 length:1068 start_codon:yes stop_codon:yes gene_type:complete